RIVHRGGHCPAAMARTAPAAYCRIVADLGGLGSDRLAAGDGPACLAYTQSAMAAIYRFLRRRDQLAGSNPSRTQAHLYCVDGDTASGDYGWFGPAGNRGICERTAYLWHSPHRT